MNSGIMEVFAALIVYRVNKAFVFFSKVRFNKKTATAKDLPEPLPPTTIKYLEGSLNKGTYLGAILIWAALLFIFYIF